MVFTRAINRPLTGPADYLFSLLKVSLCPDIVANIISFVLESIIVNRTPAPASQYHVCTLYTTDLKPLESEQTEK